MKLLNPTARFAKRFLKDEDGNVLMMFGLAVIFLVGIGGAGIDLGVQQLMRTKFQGAADAAATSAASLTAGTATITTTDRTNAANRYFYLNYPPSYYNIARPTPTVNITSSDVTVTATGNVQTSFVSNFGRPTLPATGSSTVSLAAQSVSDYDVVMVVDESGSEGRCVANANNWCTANNYNGSRMQAMKAAMVTMANSIVPPNNTNANVRMGFAGFSGQITNKWGPSSRNADALDVINRMRPVYQNFDHVGLLAGANMIAGGTAGVQNATIGGGMGDGTVAENITMPVPRTTRTMASDPRGMSPVKYVILLSDGGIMIEPSATHYHPNPISTYPDMYNSAVAAACPGRNYYQNGEVNCFPAFLDACEAVKDTGGNDNVHLIIINFHQAVNSGQGAALRSCASTTLPGSATYSATVKPDPTKDFFFAPDVSTLNTILQNVTTEIRKIRIIQ